jgi:hypothetical protein
MSDSNFVLEEKEVFIGFGVTDFEIYRVFDCCKQKLPGNLVREGFSTEPKPLPATCCMLSKEHTLAAIAWWFDGRGHREYSVLI